MNRCLQRVASGVLSALGLLAPALAQADILSKGAPAPKIALKDADGKTWKSEDYLGKKNIVVYFFPAALTGG